MKEPEESELLDHVYEMCRNDPATLARVIHAAVKGVEDKIGQVRALNADLECLAALAMAKRMKDSDAMILKKLRHINGRSHLRWDNEIERMGKR